MKRFIAGLTIVVLFLVLTSTAQVSGSGSPGHVPIWTGSTPPSTTLGNSTIFETQGMVGVGTGSPTATLHVVGPNGVSTVLSAAPTVLTVIGGIGGFSGAGGAVNLTSGKGGPADAAAFDAGGPGGVIRIVAGNGGKGGCTIINLTPRCTVGGRGGSIQLTAGTGGNGALSAPGGVGGSITLQAGLGGAVGTKQSNPGNILLAPNAGNVGIGEPSPAHTLEIKVGGTTLADAWTVRSSLRFKTNIEPLVGALEKVEQLQGVSYQRKDDGRREIGVVAEEVDKVVPEIVSHDPDTNEVQGVDYSRLTALLVEAVKAQQMEIQQLKMRLQELTSKPRH